MQRRLTSGRAALQLVSQPWVAGSESGSPLPQGTPFNQEGPWLSFPIPGALQGVTICKQSTLSRSSFLLCVCVSAHAAQGGLAAGGAEGMGWEEADLDLGEGSREVTVRGRSWLRSGSSKRK